MLHGDISLSGYSKIRVKIKFMYVCTEKKKWNKAKKQGANSPKEVFGYQKYLRQINIR